MYIFIDFPITWFVGHYQLPKWAGSYTTMLLSEHNFQCEGDRRAVVRDELQEGDLRAGGVRGHARQQAGQLDKASPPEAARTQRGR